jgi:hypothetical protein
MAFGHFLLGSYNFMVTALGSGVKWPFDKLLDLLTESQPAQARLSE